MLELNLSLNYEQATEKIRKWTDTGDLEDFLNSYKEKLSPFKTFLSNLGYVLPVIDAVEDELFKRRNEK